MPIHQPIPSKTLNLQHLGEINTPSPGLQGYYTPIPPNATKIGNPTSQCALLGLKLVQLSTLTGRIFFLSWRAKFGRSTHGANTEFVCTFTPYILHI